MTKLKTIDEQDIGCRVVVTRTNEHFYAHTVYHGNPDFQAGDSVTMGGDDIHAQTGASFLVRRRASIQRAGWLRRQLTKILSVLEITGLYEVSFTGRDER